jgi:hypothetical protein
MLSIRNLALALILILSASHLAFAQAQPAADGRITGVVRHSETRAPLPMVGVSAGGQRTTSDGDGRFLLTVVAGRVRLELSLDGFYPLDTTIAVEVNGSTDAEFLLVPRAPFASSVDVVAAPAETTPPAAVALAPLEVMRTPGALDNVFRTLQTLPGVSATEEFGSRLAVRGGAPDQNLTVMDGVEIHDPYRLFGLTSAFNPDTISRFELATGGFSVKYGDRLSSLLLVENREGTRRDKLDGSASLSVTDANVVFEGQLPPQASGSWLVSARRTYYDLVASRVTDSEFPRFSDLQAKGVWDLAPGRTLSLFGLRSRQDAALTIDEDNARGEFNDNTNNDLVSLRFDTVLGASARSHTSAAYSNNASTFGVDAAIQNRSQRANTPDDSSIDQADVRFERSLALRDLSVRQEVSWANGSHLIETGGELHRLETHLSYLIRGDRNPTAVNGSSQQGGAGLPDSLLSRRTVTRGGLWLQDRWAVRSRASVEAGVRIDRSGTGRETLLSPRVSLSFGVAENTRLRAALGRYTQSPGYEKLVQSDYVLDLTGAEGHLLHSEKALQASAGLEHELGVAATVRLEGYYRRSSDLLIGRLETDAERATRLGRYDFPTAFASSLPVDPIITTVPTNDGRGRAYGFDLFVSRTASAGARLQGWASYTWGRAERESYDRTYAFEYDRRHALSAVAAYRLSDRWELATTTRIASGFPRTAPIALRVAAEADTADRDRDGNTTELVPAVGPSGLSVYAVSFGGIENLNNARLPLFARVDLRVTWRPRGARGRWEMYLEIINLLNRRNAGSLEPELEYDPSSDRPRIVEKRDQSIPRFPTLGLRFRF